MKKLFLLLCISGAVISCKKDTDTKVVNPPNAESLGELTFDKNFNWSSSLKGNLEVHITSDTATFTVDGQEIQVVDENDKVLDRAIVDGEHASLYITKPQVNKTLYLHFPSTGDKKEITKTGNVDFFVKSNFFNVDYQTMASTANKGKKAGIKGKAAQNNLVVNGDFEIDDFLVLSSGNLATGQWYVYSNSKYNWKSVNGGHAFESKNSSYGYAYQFIPVTGGDQFTTSAICSDDFLIYIGYYTAGGSYLGYTTFNESNGNISGSGTVHNNADFVLLKVYGDKNEWIDDVTFSVVSPIVDTDNDGVADEDDDYPNDASRAYTSYFPTNGYQTVAFEDLWPAKGDFDFNDMVLSNNVVYTADASNNKVDATFTISVDAVGSGLANGLALVFTDDNKQFIANDIISSVSGDATEDPDVTNGVIVFPHVFNAQSQYYKNNGEGPSAQPDVFTFTVTFNSNVNGLNIVPDVYIYRSADRGLEVHLNGFSGTSAANPSYNSTVDDVNGTYLTATGLPWALEIITPDKSFEHPLEKVDILVAYPQFQVWAESNGTQNQDWMESGVLSKIFDAL